MAIEIKNCSGEDVSCLMAKGHVDLGEFKKAAAAYYEAEESMFDGWDGPEHLWWRWVPCNDGDYKGFYHPAEPGSRGAFACTVLACY